LRETKIQLKMKEMLTVIIPCYNIEAYLRACLDSVRAQSYKDFRTILVDDCSTDGTGRICDEYAAMDARFSVLHTENGGLPMARKKGMDAAETEYVTYVDGDDVIHLDMYRLMMAALEENEKADIVVCGVADMYGDEVKHRYTAKVDGHYEEVNHIDGVLRILDDTEWQSYMYNKIYRRKLFDGLVFPIGRNLDEDTSVMHLLFHKASLSLYIPSELYYYRHREGSICLSYGVESMTKKAVDRIAARWERLQFVEEHSEYHKMLNKQRNNFLAVGLAVMRIAAKYPAAFPAGFFAENRKRIKDVRPQTYMTEYFNSRKRLELFFIRHLPAAFRLVYKLIPAW